MQLYQNGMKWQKKKHKSEHNNEEMNVSMSIITKQKICFKNKCSAKKWSKEVATMKGLLRAPLVMWEMLIVPLMWT